MSFYMQVITYMIILKWLILDTLVLTWLQLLLGVCTVQMWLSDYAITKGTALVIQANIPSHSRSHISAEFVQLLKALSKENVQRHVLPTRAGFYQLHLTKSCDSQGGGHRPNYNTGRFPSGFANACFEYT
jgi:hypothetical protein